MGWSRKMTVADSVQLYGLSTVLVPLAVMEQGPSSKSRPVVDEQPGPPLS